MSQGEDALATCFTQGEDALATYIHISDQSTNDLTKAIDFCRARGWKRLVIVGATGKREDHSLGNIFRAMESGIPIVTDEGRFLPACCSALAVSDGVVERRETRDARRKASTSPSTSTSPLTFAYFLTLTLPLGSPLSVFTTDTAAKMVSTGLEWPLDGVEFKNLYCATLNRTTAKRVKIESTAPFFVYEAVAKPVPH